MIPIFQTRKGREGNCWPACLASILETTIEEADACACHNEDWIEQTEKFLNARGLTYIEVKRNADGSWPFTAPPDGHHVILGATNPRSGLPHVVVARVRLEKSGDQDTILFEIVHDPLGIPADEYTEIDACIFLLPLMP